ncbi:MAG: multiprotein bridging factor aMBF1 [Candidatus Heimdallarchaeota archaeon]
MSCEICGTFAGPDLVESEVDNVKMFICKKCAKFGMKTSDKKMGDSEEIREESEVTFVKSQPGGKGPSVSHVKVKTGGSISTPSRAPRRRRDDLYGNEVLVEDYGDVIKTARKARGLSLEDFAQLINEKASLLQKIEKSDFNPPESLIIKIERKLDISLREEASAPVFTGFTSKKETTLGDVVKLKKKRRD